MIKFLRLRNLATIEDIRIDWEDGFSVLTGETGAGKSIIIDGIRLVCGEKGSPDLVRAGTDEASVEAIFTRPTDAVPAGDGGSGDIILQRLLAGSGGKAYQDGVLVPLKKLKETAAGLIDVYGQNDHVFLLQLESHLAYLDQYAGSVPLREETGRAAQELRRLARLREEWKSKERERGQRLDFLEFQISEIEKAGLRPGEEEDLRGKRLRLRNAEKVRGLVDDSYDLAYGGDASLHAVLGRLLNRLEELSLFDPAFREMKETLVPFGITIRELSDLLVRFRDRGDESPERLEEIEERLSLIERFKRKYGAEIGDIGEYLDRLKAEREDFLQIKDRLFRAEEDIAAAAAVYAAAAEKLSKTRRTAARELAAVIEKEIALLGMKNARFEVRIDVHPFRPDEPESARDAGVDAVEFLISPNPGEPPKPLRKIASGGELSRIMLALKSAAQGRDEASTLIFDEIDAGIGGKTAEFVAQKLRSLASRHQVLCVTHLPQIASFAAHHYTITKRTEKDRTFTTIRKLNPDQRVEELARLMSGSLVTETSLANARDMLKHNREK
ncbi:MAG: DNA repair protein RecN [Candidatus Aminicenantes bacterium]|nr:DNA repair protein RecN [Candidatus Aminicenantes bacterium]